MPTPSQRNLAAACAVATACGWNLTAVGAVAGPLAAHYGTSLGTIGLLGSGLWLTHALVQAPAGEACDRVGVRAVGGAAMATLLLTNLVALLLADVTALGVLRVLTGAGCGATMVTASLRSRPAGAVGQGAVGGAVSAGAALAVATGPLLEHALGWRAPYLAGAALAALCLPVTALRGLPAPALPPATAVVADGAGVALTRLLPLAAVLACTIIVSFSLGNWIATILDRAGTFGPVAAGVAGATVVGGSVITRPLGGLLVARHPSLGSRLVVGSLLAAAGGAGALALVRSPALVLVAMVVLGLAAGLPFAAVVHAAAQSAPDRPGAALGLVGTAGTAGGVVAIALLGVAVDAGAVRLAFAVLAVAALGAAAAFRARRPARAAAPPALAG